MPSVEHKRRPTLREIAAEAGVSIPTVSKVVKGRPDVSPGLREKIQDILVDRGYESPSAQPLSPASKAVELHFDSMASTNNLEIMRGVIHAADRIGTDVVVKITPQNFTGVSWVESVSRAQHEGLILVTSRLDDDQQDAFASIPLLLSGSTILWAVISPPGT
jgi:DNA-binding LacI/PurR family transcriptional regulator